MRAFCQCIDCLCLVTIKGGYLPRAGQSSHEGRRQRCLKGSLVGVRCKRWGGNDSTRTWTSGPLFRLLSELYLSFVPTLLLHFFDDFGGRKSVLGQRDFWWVIRNTAVPGSI